MVLLFLSFGFAKAQDETVLRPFDRIRITSTGPLGLSVDRVLGADGAITLPGLPVLFLAGKTAAEAVAEIEKVGGRKVGKAGLSLLSASRPSALFRGTVKVNGSISLIVPKTLKDVVELAQPLEGCDINAVTIITAAGEKIVADCEAGGLDLPLRPGDQIVFQFASVANEILILGAVNDPGSKKYVRGETLEEAIARAGGLTGHADVAQIHLLRNSQPLSDAGWTEAGKKVVLKRGDLIQVPLVGDARYVSVIGYIKTQGLVPFKPGMTLLEAIAAAGGTTTGAGLNAIEIRKVFGGMGRTKKYDLTAVKKGSKNDPVLAAADVVFVPAFVFKAPNEKQSGFRPVVPPRRLP